MAHVDAFVCLYYTNIHITQSDSSSWKSVLRNTSPEVSSGSLGPRMEAALGESPQPEIWFLYWTKRIATKKKCLLGLPPILLGHQFSLQLGNMTAGKGLPVVKYWQNGHTPEQARQMLSSSSKATLFSRHSSQAVLSPGVVDVCKPRSSVTSDVVIATTVVLPSHWFHCSWQLADESSSKRTLWHLCP